MAYAVEARVFDNGKIVAKKRAAEPGEISEVKHDKNCDVWVDIFETAQGADEFLEMYKQT